MDGVQEYVEWQLELEGGAGEGRFGASFGGCLDAGFFAENVDVDPRGKGNGNGNGILEEEEPPERGHLAYTRLRPGRIFPQSNGRLPGIAQPRRSLLAYSHAPYDPRAQIKGSKSSSVA